MKKTTMLLLCLLSVILLTGCGSNKLSCSLDNKEENYVSYNYELAFSDDMIESIKITWNYDFSEVEDFNAIGCESLEDCINKAKAQIDSCGGATAFENCKVEKETDAGVIISADVSKKELDNKEANLNSKTSKEDAKKRLEDSGFTCE